ncbi:Gluconate transport-inducing protein [Coemansia pectinata]|uniref:Gluconate transport-inducing protein n=1 Tax=Coemansia pectinata TaxID=1052879 RepID=A0A9W8GYM0_9FUNG|nr:Gluconate transport-inducing protein [Coemansia pectinata]
MSNTTTTDTEATYHGYIETTDDALLVFEACRLGMLKRRTRRLCDSERRQITSGSVFVWDEGESGIRRWTDGKRWSPSRVSGCFLVYTELEPKQGGERNTKAGTTSPTFASDQAPRSGGLVKKALSLFTTHNSKLHLVCYYRKEDVGKSAIVTPSRDSLLCNIDIPRSLYPDILPEMVHVLSSPTVTAAASAQQHLYHQSTGGQERRRMSVVQPPTSAKSSPLAICSPVTQLRSADGTGGFDRRPLTAHMQPSQSLQRQAQQRIPAHIAVDKSDSHCCRRRRDSLAVMSTGFVGVPTSRRYQTTTNCQDNEMLHRLDTGSSSKPVLGVGVENHTPPNNTSGATDVYLHPPPPAFLPMQSRLVEQNTTASFRSVSHPSPSPYTDDSNTLPSIGSSGRYAMPVGPATAPSSRRNTVFNGDNASNSGTETSLPSISELLNSISSAEQLSSPMPAFDHEVDGGLMDGAGIQSLSTVVRPLTISPKLPSSSPSSAKARAKYLVAPWSRHMCNYSMKSAQASPLVHDPYTIY